MSVILCAFQSTHPLRGATKIIRSKSQLSNISIHAPLAGCDPVPIRATSTKPNFNPRTPCGVRPPMFFATWTLSFISIHAPLAGCDDAQEPGVQVVVISIHAPLAGCDYDRLIIM
mgnify:CR=1 FL=1